MKSLLTALLISLLLGCTSLRATPLEDKIIALKKAVQAEISKKKGDSPKGNSDVYALNTLSQIEAEMDGANTPNIDQQIQQIMTIYPSDEVEQAGNDLLKELHLEIKAKQDKIEADGDVLIQKTKDALHKAQKPEDLDKALEDLQNYSLPPYAYNYSGSTIGQKINQAIEFTKEWQNYLSDQATDQIQQALQDLSNLSQNNNSLSLIPRSEILSRIALLKKQPPATSPNSPQSAQALDPAVALLLQINGPDDLDSVLKKVDALLPADGNLNMPAASNANQVHQYLRNLAQNYHDVKKGLPVTIDMRFLLTQPIQIDNQQYSFSPEAKSRLVNMFLKYYFSLDQSLPPQTDERYDSYLNRILADAQSRNDWPLIQKVLQFEFNVFQDATTQHINNTYRVGIDLLVSGLNLDQAGQYVLAVQSYELALKTVDTRMPVKFIGDKLAVIEKAHPNEFKQGMDLIINPPPPNNMYEGYPFGRYPFPGYPLQNQIQPLVLQPPPSAVITIPAAKRTTPSSASDDSSPPAKSKKKNSENPRDAMPAKH